MSIYAPTLATLWRHIDSYGLDPEAIFATEGITREALKDNSERVPFGVVDRLRSEAARQSGSESFGLKAADFWHPSYMGALGYAWLLSPTLLVALETCARYIRMVNDSITIELDKGPDTVIVIIDFLQESSSSTIREDSGLAMLLSMCRANYGPEFHPKSVEIKHLTPKNPAPFYSFFKSPIKFDADRTALIFDREQAETVCLNANEQLRQFNLDSLNAYLTELDSSKFCTQVRDEILHQLPQGKTTDATIASALHMTSRTLQRKLKAENTTFKSLLTEVRTELAKRYIRDKNISLTEISFLLGFAETSSFSRAYKQWTGAAPSIDQD